MTKKKSRESIPSEVAARVLFLSDRICCVCRVSGKPVQIHHVDGDRNNNSLQNLAVLCFDCHRDTQIRGGFDRKLDVDQVILYRDDWHRIVAQQRAVYGTYRDTTRYEDGHQLELVTSIAEIYRENQEFELLAIHYHSIGNHELRDKYVELAIRKEATDQTISYLHCLQGKPGLIPEDVIEREIARYTRNKDWLQRARFYLGLGKYHKAAMDYIRGIGESLQENRVFTAAFYLKELVEEGLIEELFVVALKQATEEGDLWWQVRALQELGWHKELHDLVLRNVEEIERSGNPRLHLLLANARGDETQWIELEKLIARSAHMPIAGDGATIEDNDDTDLSMKNATSDLTPGQ